MRVEITVAGEQQLVRTLARIRANITNLHPVLEQVGSTIRASMDRQFTTSGNDVTGRWAPLSPEYRRWKSQHFPGQPTLVRTGALRRDYTTTAGTRISGNEIMQVSNLPYAAFHQQGTRHMPARKLELTAQTKTAMMKAIQRYCLTGVA